MRPTPCYAPDGFASARYSDAAVRRYEGASEGVATTDRVMLEAVLAHERHDDGLVHSHGWALSETMAGPGAGISRPTLRAEVRRVQADDRFDDGLVHGHAWAHAASSQAPRPRPNAWSVPLAMLNRRSEDRYDDGLVHNHDWAVTGK